MPEKSGVDVIAAVWDGTSEGIPVNVGIIVSVGNTTVGEVMTVFVITFWVVVSADFGAQDTTIEDKKKIKMKVFFICGFHN